MKRFRNKAKVNSFQLIDDEDITEGPRLGECSQGQKEKLVIKIDLKRLTKAARSRKRISQGIAIAHKKLKTLQLNPGYHCSTHSIWKNQKAMQSKHGNCGDDKSFEHNMAGEEYLKRVDNVFWKDKLQQNSIT